MILHFGNCLEMLAGIEADSIDAVVTDPPYGLSDPPDIAEVLRHWLAGDSYEHGKTGFMGKGWDSFVPGPEVWKEVYRVLKPGAYAVIFSGTRTVDLMGISLRLAGFFPKDLISWLRGQGMPKSHNVSKAIDRAAGAEREVLGVQVLTGTARTLKGNNYNQGWAVDTLHTEHLITAPATPEAEQWEGWGTALKPSQEPILLVQKPLGERTIAANVLRHGAGVLNVEACRIHTADSYQINRWTDGAKPFGGGAGTPFTANERPTGGRWPGNFVLTHVEDQPCSCEGESKDCLTCQGTGEILGCQHHEAGDWKCVSGCPVRELDAQTSSLHASGNKSLTETSAGKDYNSTSYHISYQGQAQRDRGGSGGASRFFYHAKATSHERYLFCRECNEVYPRSHALVHRGKGHTIFQHPTQKPLPLVEWLVTLVTPPGGVVLDPFMGTGTTGVAAVQHGYDFLGADIQEEAVHIAKHRIQGYKAETPAKTRNAECTPAKRTLQSLFGRK